MTPSTPIGPGPQPCAEPSVQLREITADTVRRVTDLAVRDDQKHLVATNAESLAEALFAPEAWYRAVDADGELAGFVMLYDESLRSPPPLAPRVVIWRFMVDARFQGRGVGRAALQQVIAHVRAKGCFAKLELSYVPGPQSPEGFYLGLGFKPTGRVEDGEAVLELPLGAAAARLVEPQGERRMAEGLEGGCLCGAVRFRATQAPMRTIACHCTFCQKVTGSAYFAESMFAMDAVQFNEGKLASYEHVSDGSQKKVFVHFCPNCGTTVSLTFERWPDVRGIARGCYDDPDAVTVSSHIWTRSAQGGTALPEGVDCFARGRMTLDGQPEPSVKHPAPVMTGSQRRPTP